MTREEQILQRIGLKYDELSPDEKKTLFEMSDTLRTAEMTIKDAREYIRRLRDACENERTQLKETPDTWLGILVLLIPLYGLIKKWYQDQKELELKARIKNYILIEAMLSTPAAAKKQLERAIAGVVGKK